LTVAVVVPTIDGRERWLERIRAAYWRTAPYAHVYVEKGHRSCGEAWLAGTKKAEQDGFDYLHFGSDDLEPQEGWLKPAIEAVDAGFIPAPLVFHADGTLDSAGLAGFGQYRGPCEDWQLVEGTTVPFMTREMWERIGMIPVHYCSDLYVSTVGRKHGWETAIRTGMRFTHHVAPEGRDYGRVNADTQEYLRLVAEAA
jgi:hypothetical protein